jgi:hypothetical protein
LQHTFIEHPTPVGRPAYEDAVRRMQERLVTQPGLKAVYQIGGVSTPGVSDIDMVVVFDDEATCPLDPLADLSADDRYLFIHSLYGSGASHFRAAQRHSFFHNYKLLWGTDLLDPAAVPAGEAEARLKAQVALEYLLKMYISLVMQRVYHVFKVRSFFLHVKAIQYDLDFLGVDAGALYDLTQQFIRWRASWFDERPAPRELNTGLEAFFEALQGFLRAQLGRHHFYLPERRRYRLARCMWLEPGPDLGFRHEGTALPAVFSRLGSLYYKLQNRLNRFYFTCPVHDDMPEVLAQRFALIDDMKRHNRRHLPHFETLSSSLHLT